MKVVIYEWCSSGGLHGPDAACIAPAAVTDGAAGDRSAVVAEGMAMLAALVRDAAKDATLDVTVLVDAMAWPALAGEPAAWAGAARVEPVPAGQELNAVARAAARADWTVVIAPETAGLLARRVESVRRAGGRPAACSTRFIEIAGDKQATAAALAAAGVPVPAGRSLAPGQPLPEGFHLPAVRKARDGVGCDGLWIARTPDEALRSAPAAERIEAFVPGIPVGVSCLCGPAGIQPLPPVRQRFSPGDRPRYLGGELVVSARWRERAETLAVRAIAALARSDDACAAGWVGVDMMLGAGDDGGDDRVLEVNPRLTTSFVGLAAVEEQSLVRLLCEAAAGLPPQLRPLPGRTVEYDAAGTVRMRDG